MIPELLVGLVSLLLLLDLIAMASFLIYVPSSTYYILNEFYGYFFDTFDLLIVIIFEKILLTHFEQGWFHRWVKRTFSRHNQTCPRVLFCLNFHFLS